MDPLTHSLIGAVAAKSVGTSKRRFWIMAALGSFPDLDVLANVFGGWAHLFQHRGLSHSLVGVVAQAFLLAFVLRKWDTGLMKQRAFHYSLPIALHVFCDYLTSYGVPLLSPFTQAHFSWDLMSSVNLLPLAITGMAVWWMHNRQLSGWKVTGPVWAVWILYFALITGGRAYAARLTPMPDMTMIPSITNPFSWRGVAIDPSAHAYHHYSVDLLSGGVSFDGRQPQPNEDFPVKMSEKSLLVQEFLKDNRWPVVRVTPTADGSRVEWGSIIYSVRGMVRGKVAVEVAADGRLLREEPIVSFWDPTLN